MRSTSIKSVIIAAIALIITFSGTQAQDTVYVWYGNLDGSAINGELNSNLEIEIYARAMPDVAVGSAAFNLGARDIVFDSLLSDELGEIYYPFSEWDGRYFSGTTGQPFMPEGWHSQCWFGIKDLISPYDAPPFDSEVPILIGKYVYHIADDNNLIGSLTNSLGPGYDRIQGESYADDTVGIIAYPVVEYFSPVQLPGGGWISGTIVDDLDEPVPDVEVICHTSMLSVISSAEGQYKIGVPPGTHDLEFAVEGYRDILEQGITVVEGQTVTRNIVMEIGVGMDENYNQLIPEKFELKQNYPNPFNATTTIEYSLNISSHVNLMVYDIQGRLVEKLVDGIQQAGIHHVNWNAGDLPSGIYMYRITTDTKSVTSKMLLLK